MAVFITIIGVLIGLVLVAVRIHLNTRFWGWVSRPKNQKRGTYVWGPDGKIVWDPKAKRKY